MDEIRFFGGGVAVHHGGLRADTGRGSCAGTGRWRGKHVYLQVRPARCNITGL